MIKDCISRLFEKTGYKVVRVGREKERLLSENSQRGALYRCWQRNLEIKTVIDIGASDGRWSKICMDYFPDSFYFLIEAQKVHEAELEKFRKGTLNTDYLIAAAGDSEGELFFDNSSLFGGTASHLPGSKNCVKVKSVRVDKVVSEYNLISPFLIKLDTHGFETPILEGAAETLGRTNLAIIEAYNFKIAQTGIRFYELCAYMEEKGFLPIDMVDLIYRKKDNSFWQTDIIFIRKDRAEFKDNSYN